MELLEAASYDKALGYSHSVKVEKGDGAMDVAANFRSKVAAKRWMAFMAGGIHTLVDERTALAA
jgi:hypothetical protein